jgi:hypothetical protein
VTAGWVKIMSLVCHESVFPATLLHHAPEPAKEQLSYCKIASGNEKWFAGKSSI